VNQQLPVSIVGAGMIHFGELFELGYEEMLARAYQQVLGGVDKGNDYGLLRELVREKVRAIVCLGRENDRIHEAFRDIVPRMVDAGSAEEAVAHAFQLARKGDTVLLSPACASFDLFRNYEDRGRRFKMAVKEL